MGHIIDYVIDVVCDTFVRIPHVYNTLQTFLHKSLRHNTDNQFGLFFCTIVILALITTGVINLGTENMYYIYLTIIWLCMIIGGTIYFIEYQAKPFDERVEEETPNFPVADIFASAIIALWVLTLFHMIASITSIPISILMAL